MLCSVYPNHTQSTTNSKVLKLRRRAQRSKKSSGCCCAACKVPTGSLPFCDCSLCSLGWLAAAADSGWMLAFRAEPGFLSRMNMNVQCHFESEPRFALQWCALWLVGAGLWMTGLGLQSQDPTGSRKWSEMV